MRKKVQAILTGCLLCLGLGGCSLTAAGGVLAFVLGALLFAVAGWSTWNYVQYLKKKSRTPARQKKQPLPRSVIALYAAALFLFVIGFTVSCDHRTATPPEETTSVTTEPTEPPVLFRPEAAATATPESLGIRWEIFDGGQSVSAYDRETPISFGPPEDYFELPGICTFRGNNYRNSSSYGTAKITDKTLSIAWDHTTSTLEGSGWSGSGWTGQPLIVQWDARTRSNMDLYPEKKNKDGLVEVIYATLDGNIYFLDLEDGSPTREPVNVGMCFKGSGSLDPRGYPLLYVGAGDVNGYGKRPRMYIVSLLDGKILYTYGDEDPLSQRKDNDRWCAFDSAPLVHKESDTLIWPGENGLLYTIRLNTSYDPAAGTISVSPDAPVLTRYSTNRSGEESYWLGYEASASIVENYLYVSENGGMFYCVDLNTMELIWAQDTKEDSNASPVFEPNGEGGGCLYTAPSLHWTKDRNDFGTISVYKLDAITGEILWEVPFHAYTKEGVSGGVQSTPLLGKEGTSLEGTLFCSVSRTPSMEKGVLVALDTETGAEKWRYVTEYYAWSSPVAIYTPEGKGYVLLADSEGHLLLFDGSNGSLLYRLSLNSVTEATPAVFENTLVLGVRFEKIYGITIK